MLPTDVLDQRARDFWLNVDIHAAGKEWEAEQRERAEKSGTAGAATGAEQKELVEAQEARAEQREQRDGQPSLSEQLAALDDSTSGGAG